MDKILNQLQGKAFHLSDEILTFLSDRYESLIGEPIPDLDFPGFHPEFFKEIISKHRKQFQTAEYSESRISNPTTGTIDHIHSEITASTSVKIGKQSGYSGYALELLRCAAHMHDSDRSFPKTMVGGEQEVRHDPEGYREYKRRHAENSVLMAKQLAESANRDGFQSPDEYLKDVRYLILRHEIGGIRDGNGENPNTSAVDPSLDIDRLTDIVTDADSLSYFEANILTNWEESFRNVAALTNKVHFMYDRMSKEAQSVFKETVLNSREHILGVVETDDPDVTAIRSILLKECH